MKSAYLEVLRNLVFRSIQCETRLSERQVALLRWDQIHNNEIVTCYRRRVEMSRELVAAISLLPRNSSYVFFGSALLPRQDNEEMLELKQRLAEEDDARRSADLGRRFVVFRHNRGISALTK